MLCSVAIVSKTSRTGCNKKSRNSEATTAVDDDFYETCRTVMIIDRRVVGCGTG